jgi:hypothetical protein
MSKIEVNQISSQCGSTLTIGQSGDTVTLACGATQTGFGRTGTVDWDTTAKTASFTAVSGMVILLILQWSNNSYTYLQHLVLVIL